MTEEQIERLLTAIERLADSHSCSADGCTTQLCDHCGVKIDSERYCPTHSKCEDCGEQAATSHCDQGCGTRLCEGCWFEQHENGRTWHFCLSCNIDFQEQHSGESDPDDYASSIPRGV